MTDRSLELALLIQQGQFTTAGVVANEIISTAREEEIDPWFSMEVNFPIRVQAARAALAKGALEADGLGLVIAAPFVDTTVLKVTL